MFHLPDTFLKHGPKGIGMRHSERFMLWIDAVGGYWVCLGDEVTLGQPDSQGTADVPILGDLSSRHARIRRDGESYIVEACRDVRVNSRLVRDIAWLGDGSRMQLGGAVHLLFRRSHPLSATGRIDFVSRHRTQPSADSVLLMADTCVLGPKPHCHVVCRDWTYEVVLFRRDGELFCRMPGPFQIDGTACNGCGRITTSSRIESNGFSFNLEAITIG
jgi:hypothetical protein